MTPEQRKQAEGILHSKGFFVMTHKEGSEHVRKVFIDPVIEAMEAYASLRLAEEKRMPTEEIEEILKRIDKDVEKPMVTAQFGDMWKFHAIEHYDFPDIVNIAWRQGRRALLLERELRNRMKGGDK
jgi:hypothetical protein